MVGTDSIIAIKTSLSEPVRFVLIRPSQKSEKKLHTPGYSYPYFLSYGGGKLVWVENHADPRWENRNYSVIKLKEINKGFTKQLSHRSRYMSATISKDGKRIVATENTAKNVNSLVLICSENGEVIKIIPSPDNAFLQRPQWSDDGRKIIVIYLTENGEGIMSYGLDDETWRVLVAAGKDDLQASYLRNDSLFYISSTSGTDNIYLLTPEKRLTAVTSSRFGANELSMIGSEIVFSDYTSDGNDICTVSLKDVSSDPGKTYKSVSYLADRFEMNSGKTTTGSIEKVYTAQPYRKWQHLFGFHSWMPFYADIQEIQSNPASIRPGATLMTQNQLSTLTATMGYEYSADQRHMFHSKITWKGWYPVFESQFDYGNEALIYDVKSNGTRAPDPSQIYQGYQFINTISLPLTISSGRFSQFFYLSGSSNFRNNYLYNNEISKYWLGLTQLTGRFYFTNYYRTALRDIFPEWAQTIDLMYSWYPFEKEYLGSSLSLRSAFYFPGILRNNSVKIRLEAEKQTTPYKFYHMGNRISFPRSYDNISSMTATFFSAEYFAPLFYPI
jgi:hypothetical protein